MILTFLANNTIFKPIESPEDVNHIVIERNQYGFIFTNLEVNGQTVKAMIDFGDPSTIQLSSSFVEKNNIPVEATNAQAMHMDGSTFSINQGVVEQVKIGTWEHKDVEFKSSPGDLESVSTQIGTTFNAVVGWGYFNKYFTQMNYADNSFIVSKSKPKMKDSLLRKSYDKTSNYLSVSIELDEQEANFILDTGSGYSLIDSSYAEKIGLEALNLELGDKALPLNLMKHDLSMLKQLNAVGIIGGDFLQEYKILLDPFEHELIFYSNK
jgi:predicted aspartyl protease